MPIVSNSKIGGLFRFLKYVSSNILRYRANDKIVLIPPEVCFSYKIFLNLGKNFVLIPTSCKLLTFIPFNIFSIFKLNDVLTSSSLTFSFCFTPISLINLFKSHSKLSFSFFTLLSFSFINSIFLYEFIFSLTFPNLSIKQSLVEIYGAINFFDSKFNSFSNFSIFFSFSIFFFVN